MTPAFAYEPFGKRRMLVGALDPNDTIAGVTTDRGFTNHEHLDSLDLIHMNGRVYDPSTGRFLSADPGVPYPTNIQSYNGVIVAGPPSFTTTPAPVNLESNYNKITIFINGASKGVASYVNGIFVHLPKAALDINGFRGGKKIASEAAIAVIEALELIKENPRAAMKLACIACLNLTPQQETELSGRLWGRLTLAGSIFIATPVGIPAGVAAIAGNLINAGANLNDRAAVLRTILFGGANDNSMP